MRYSNVKSKNSREGKRWGTEGEKDEEMKEVGEHKTRRRGTQRETGNRRKRRRKGQRGEERKMGRTTQHVFRVLSKLSHSNFLKDFQFTKAKCIDWKLKKAIAM